MNNTLSYFTTEEIKEELSRRESKKDNNGLPAMLNEIDFAKLTYLVGNYVEFINSEVFTENNAYNYALFECVMETYYGDEFWVWYNNRIQENIKRPFIAL